MLYTDAIYLFQDLALSRKLKTWNAFWEYLLRRKQCDSPSNCVLCEYICGLFKTDFEQTSVNFTTLNCAKLPKLYSLCEQIAAQAYAMFKWISELATKWRLTKTDSYALCRSRVYLIRPLWHNAYEAFGTRNCYLGHASIIVCYNKLCDAINYPCPR